MVDMSKICNFDILVEEAFMSFNPDRTNINPDENDSLLSVINGFEDNHWLTKAFRQFVFDNITLTALNAEERSKLVYSGYSSLIEAAKHLRLIDDKGKGSEIAEIVLYGIMKHHFGALSAVPKIFYKQNDHDNAKGADGVHIVLTEDGDFQLWLGEAKFYNSIEDSRLGDPIDSVCQMLKTAILKKEVGIMTSLNELDYQIADPVLLKNVKDSLQAGLLSVDILKKRIHVPILLLHECEITNGATELTNEYKQAIIEKHRERATAFFTKQIDKLRSIPHYEWIQFHLILFPVPKKDEIVNWFLIRGKQLQEDANE